MRECDNCKIHKSSNFLLSMSSNNVGHLIASTIMMMMTTKNRNEKKEKM